MKKMSKLMFVAAATLLVGGLASCGETTPDGGETEFKVAMITDYGDITDQSFNQSTWEGLIDFCDDNNIKRNYYKPNGDSTAERVQKAELAISEGYNVIAMPGYAFAGTINKVAPQYPDVKFIALDVSKGDLLEDYFAGSYNYNPDDPQWSSYKLPENVYCAIYQEELAGYMAGYAAVKEGYTKLGFLGGKAVPAVMRYGYGFVQGCDAAADGKDIQIRYVYGNQFYGDPDITARTDIWCQGEDATEVIFACGGGIYTSACESAKKYKKKVIGVDVDQSYIIDGTYEVKGMCITSAMKGLSATIKTKLKDTVIDGKWTSTIETLGLVSGTNPAENYVQLPMDTWTLTNFTVNDYKALVKDLYDGKIKVSNDTTKEPTVSKTTSVDYQKTIKG